MRDAPPPAEIIDLQCNYNNLRVRGPHECEFRCFCPWSSWHRSGSENLTYAKSFETKSWRCEVTSNSLINRLAADQHFFLMSTYFFRNNVHLTNTIAIVFSFRNWAQSRHPIPTGGAIIKSQRSRRAHLLRPAWGWALGRRECEGWMPCSCLPRSLTRNWRAGETEPEKQDRISSNHPTVASMFLQMV